MHALKQPPMTILEEFIPKVQSSDSTVHYQGWKTLYERYAPTVYWEIWNHISTESSYELDAPHIFAELWAVISEKFRGFKFEVENNDWSTSLHGWVKITILDKYQEHLANPKPNPPGREEDLSLNENGIANTNWIERDVLYSKILNRTLEEFSEYHRRVFTLRMLGFPDSDIAMQDKTAIGRVKNVRLEVEERLIKLLNEGGIMYEDFEKYGAFGFWFIQRQVYNHQQLVEQGQITQDIIAKKFGSYIHSARKNASITRAELAVHSGLSQASLLALEHGLILCKNISEEWVSNLAQALQLDINILNRILGHELVQQPMASKNESSEQRKKRFLFLIPAVSLLLMIIACLCARPLGELLPVSITPTSTTVLSNIDVPPIASLSDSTPTPNIAESNAIGGEESHNSTNNTPTDANETNNNGLNPESSQSESFENITPVETCPLSGLPVDEPSLLELNPALVSIPNFPASARKVQAGLSFTPYVFEIFIGDGMTRFLAMFYCDFPGDTENLEDATVGPIRSGRLPYDPIRKLYSGILITAGASSGIPSADCNIYSSNPDDINGTSISIKEIKECIESHAKDDPDLIERLRSNEYDIVTPANGSLANIIQIFINNLNQAKWQYDPSTGAYLRLQNDPNNPTTYNPLTDSLDGQPLAFENIIVLPVNYQEISPTEFDVNFYYQRSDAILFRDGRMYEICWSTLNGDYEQETGLFRPIKFEGLDGKPFPLKPGQTWIHVVTPNTVVTEPEIGKWNVRFYEPLPNPQGLSCLGSIAGGN